MGALSKRECTMYSVYYILFGIADENDGSECHKLIMVFSDGGTENPTKILNVYTNSSREITSDARIFTYAVGNFIISEIFYSINLQN